MNFNNYQPGSDPFVEFESWLGYAIAKGEIEPYAMSLATSVKDQPHVRTVLFKGLSQEGLCFFTNYESNKSIEIEQNNNVAVNFHWKTVGLQVRVEGQAHRISRSESEIYFLGRPRGSQLSAWASKQSEALQNREQLEDQRKDIEKKFAEKPMTCPPFWGGFRITPVQFEFWVGREDRLHDRFLFTKFDGNWVQSRLSP